ncbi:MAG: hypothetical protein AAGB19_18430 [Cyanobacteria bacterium P01_F01_bin.3]
MTGPLDTALKIKEMQAQGATISPEDAAVLESIKNKAAREKERRELLGAWAIPSRVDSASPTIRAMTLLSGGNGNVVRDRMKEASYDVQAGQLDVLEEMLSDHAMLLNERFTDLLLKADKHPAIDHTLKITRAALELQKQCTSIIKELAKLKSPLRTQIPCPDVVTAIDYFNSDEIAGFLGVECIELEAEVEQQPAS